MRDQASRDPVSAPASLSGNCVPGRTTCPHNKCCATVLKRKSVRPVPREAGTQPLPPRILWTDFGPNLARCEVRRASSFAGLTGLGHRLTLNPSTTPNDAVAQGTLISVRTRTEVGPNLDPGSRPMRQLCVQAALAWRDRRRNSASMQTHGLSRGPSAGASSGPAGPGCVGPCRWCCHARLETDAAPSDSEVRAGRT